MTQTLLDAATLHKLISAAGAAPSIHNTQPWRYRLHHETGTLQVRTAPGSGLRHIDPLGRALHVSVGAALFNLRLAMAHCIGDPEVCLLPDPADPALLASIRLAAPHGPGRGPGLYEQIGRRHSSRQPFSGYPLPAPVLAGLQEAADAEGATLHLPDQRETQRLLDLTALAEERNGRDADRLAETRRWIREGTGDGLSGQALGLQDATGRVPMRNFAGVRPATRLPAAAFESHPRLAVLTTARDRRVDWIRAGQGLQHVLLAATAHHVRTSMLHQALEWPDLRPALAAAEYRREHVQMLIRLGYGPEGPATARRPVSTTLQDEVPPPPC